MTEKIQSARDFACNFIPLQFAQVRDRGLPRTSLSSFTLNVVGEDAWSFRIRDGELEVVPGLDPDRLLTVSLRDGDFSRFVDEIPLEAPPKISTLGLKFLSWDAETVRLVRALSGSILLRLDDQGTARPILVSPGARPVNFDEAGCCIDCAWSDWIQLQSGKEQPMELFLAGKIRLSGNAELALALAGLLL